MKDFTMPERTNNVEPPIASDEELVARAQSGEVAAFADLVTRYQSKLMRYGRRFLTVPEDTEDAVQEAFINAYRHLSSFRRGERWSPWIYRIAHNSFVSMIRSKKREPVPFFDPDILLPHPIAPNKSDTAADVAMIRQQLDRHLEALDPKYREVLVLRYYEDLSYTEIAEILRVPKGTVGIRIKRALEKLHSRIPTHDHA